MLNCLDALQQVFAQEVAQGDGFSVNDHVAFGYFIDLGKVDHKGAMHPQEVAGFGSSNPNNLNNLDAVLYFNAFDGQRTSLWQSNGTNAGTVMVKANVEREFWANVNGTRVNTIPLNSPATSKTPLTWLETTGNQGDDFAQRIRGYLTVPQQGTHLDLQSLAICKSW